MREAVKAAGALAGDDTVDFAANVSTVKLTSDIFYNSNLMAFPALGAVKIIGRGANVFTIVAGGGRIFSIENSVFNISGATLRGGRSFEGGAILANGSLTLDGIHVDDSGLGSRYSYGGGVLFSGGSLIIRNSTFTRNFANECGAVDAKGVVSIVNSTFSGNTTFPHAFGNDGAGSALCVRSGSTATLRNTTFTNNQNGGGGTVLVRGGALDFGNTIIAGNASDFGQPEIRFESGSIVSAGNNLVGDSTGDSTNTRNPVVYQTSDKLDTPPMLGALINNGGRTPTHALLPGSPAIDAGDNAKAVDSSGGGAALTTDQRGYRRIVDGEDADTIATVDIGAFEAQKTVNISGRITARGRGAARARVTFSDDNGLTQTVMTNPFGFYRFANVPIGDNYIFEIRSKQYRFAPRAVNITEQMSNFNFTEN